MPSLPQRPVKSNMNSKQYVLYRMVLEMELPKIRKDQYASFNECVPGNAPQRRTMYLRITESEMWAVSTSLSFSENEKPSKKRLALSKEDRDVLTKELFQRDEPIVSTPNIAENNEHCPLIEKPNRRLRLGNGNEALKKNLFP